MGNQAWQPLHHQAKTLQHIHLRDMLKDQDRGKAMVIRHEDIIFDYTHQKMNVQTVEFYLQQLVTDHKIYQKIQGLFNGNHINFTQDRAVLHTALRAPINSQIHDCANNKQLKQVIDNVHGVLNNIEKFAAKVRSGEWTGASQKKLTNLIVIGIGGSYLSIQFIYEALRSHPKYKELSDGRKIRFLANVDPIDFNRAIEGLNVEETLVLVNSKTFTTAETMLNAKSVKQWLLSEYSKKGETDSFKIARKHICACSTNLTQTQKFGIDKENVFGFWDFVGGRFSVWSAIGVLPLSIHFGFETMKQFLAGGHSIDKHFKMQHNIMRNIPLMLGLIGFYNSSILGHSARAIIPYCQALCKFSPHIQQLDMQSNGKRITSKGEIVTWNTAVVNFGEPGTNGQHSFFQLLHQGRVTPVQFIGFTKSQCPFSVVGQSVNNHDQLMSNFFSQPDALAIGKTKKQLIVENTPESLIPHKEFPGDRPSLSFLFLGQLDAYKCGQLLATYEHRTSVEGFLWELNSYDQYGVQLGKVLAKNVRSILHAGGGEALNNSGINSATKKLLHEYLNNK